MVPCWTTPSFWFLVERFFRNEPWFSCCVFLLCVSLAPTTKRQVWYSTTSGSSKQRKKRKSSEQDLVLLEWFLWFFLFRKKKPFFERRASWTTPSSAKETTERSSGFGTAPEEWFVQEKTQSCSFCNFCSFGQQNGSSGLKKNSTISEFFEPFFLGTAHWCRSKLHLFLNSTTGVVLLQAGKQENKKTKSCDSSSWTKKQNSRTAANNTLLLSGVLCL